MAADTHKSADRDPRSTSDIRPSDGAGLLQEVYDELRRLARQHLANERPDHTLQATALVHEAYLRLSKQQHVPWQNRRQFLALASTAIRRILVDYARSQATAKRSSDGTRPPLMPHEPCPDVKAMWNENLEALDDALNQMTEVYPRCARVVELRHFGGLSTKEAAETLDVSSATVERDWRFARAWLKAKIDETAPATHTPQRRPQSKDSVPSQHGSQASTHEGGSAHES